MSNQTFSELDLDSPGYEFLRSHRSMNNLYLKLISLDYQREFCLKYKCPRIHRYYFSLPTTDSQEQVFIFTCLCAWLIKDKCQMNLDLAPEEYQDVDTTIGVIIEALKLLLLIDNGDQAQIRINDVISFSPARLRQGFGPEVIWTLSVLSDRALELCVENSPGLGKPQIIYHDKQTTTNEEGRRSSQTGNSGAGPLSGGSISIGQPIVGGGLTTRPLGNYKIDEPALLLTNDTQNSNKLPTSGSSKSSSSSSSSIERLSSDDWFRQVDRDSAALRVAQDAMTNGKSINLIDWKKHIAKATQAKSDVQDFIDQSRSVLEVMANRIEKQMQLIHSREQFLQTNLKKELEAFLNVWRNYMTHSLGNASLTERVASKTDLFDNHVARLKLIASQTDSRTKELNDGTKLKQLQSIIDSLKAESLDLDLKVNLLLSVYQTKKIALDN